MSATPLFDQGLEPVGQSQQFVMLNPLPVDEGFKRVLRILVDHELAMLGFLAIFAHVLGKICLNDGMQMKDGAWFHEHGMK